MYRLALVAVASVIAVASGSDTPAPRPADVAALVRQLGSEDFAKREEATARLSALDVREVPPELLAALKSPDPEVRRRAARAIKALRDRIALAALPRGERFAKRGQIDLYVASTAATDYKADDPRLWEPALAIGRQVIKAGDMTGPRTPRCPGLSPDLRTSRSAYPGLRFLRTEGEYAPPQGYARGYHG